MIRLATIILLGLILSQCTKEPAPQDRFTIPNEFILDLNQAVSQEGPVPAFHISSIHKIGCPDEELLVDYAASDEEIKINIAGVNYDTECSKKKILSYQVSDNLSPGNYNMTISLKGMIDNLAILSIKPDYYEIKFAEEKGVLLGSSKIYKIPLNVMWGSIEVSDLEDAGLLEKFKQNMHSHFSTITPAIQISPGNYGIFSITEYGSIIIGDKENTDTRVNFIFPYSESSDITWIDHFLADNPEVSLYLSTPFEVIYE